MNCELDYDRKSRILYVLKVLWEESDEDHPISAAKLAVRLLDYGIECERRSILRCFDSLEEFGFDIIRTKRGTYLGSRFLELPELRLLVDAVVSSKFITTGKSSNLIKKLAELTSIYNRDNLKGQMHINGRVKTMNESIYYNIDAVQEGIIKDRQIGFLYYNWDSEKKLVPRRGRKVYEISPWALMWEMERYYLIGYDAEADLIKHFRIDKMGDIKLLDRKRKGKKQFFQIDLSTYSVENFGMFNGKKETVTLLADKELVGVLIDHFGTALWIHETGKDQLSVTVDVSLSDRFFGWVTSMGGRVKIVSPSYVVNEYKELLIKCIGKYDDVMKD